MASSDREKECLNGVDGPADYSCESAPVLRGQPGQSESLVVGVKHPLGAVMAIARDDEGGPSIHPAEEVNVPSPPALGRWECELVENEDVLHVFLFSLGR